MYMLYIYSYMEQHTNHSRAISFLSLPSTSSEIYSESMNWGKIARHYQNPSYYRSIISRNNFHEIICWGHISTCIHIHFLFMYSVNSVVKITFFSPQAWRNVNRQLVLLLCSVHHCQAPATKGSRS